MKLRPIFSLLRQGISHAQFDDKETRERVVNVLDEMENELDDNTFEFVLDTTIEAQKDLQSHLIELLTEEMIREDTDTETVEVASAGEIVNEEE